MLALRVGILVVAVAAIAWFGLGYVQTHNQNRATALIDEPGTPSQARTAEVMRLLQRAAALNPDRGIDVLRVQAQIRAGHDAAAERIARRIVTAEPQNIDGWLALGFAAQKEDPAAARLAQAQQRKLAPPVPQAP